MRALTTLLLVLLLGTSFAQQVDYFANNPQWRQSSMCQVSYPCVENQEFIYYVHSDTVINNYTYHRIHKLADVEQMWMAPPPAGQCGGNWTLDHEVAKLRQDGKKIWRFDGNTEELLYDFDLELGDTLPQTPIQWNDNLVVTGVDSALVNGQYRKVFEVGDQFLAEGIGHNEGFLEPFPDYLECGYTFQCFALNGTTYYPNTQTPCDLTVSVQQVDELEHLLPYPNPTTDEVYFNFGKSYGNIQLSLYNSYGQLVHQMQTQNVTHLKYDMPSSPGIYTLQIELNDNSSKRFRILKL
ncbi:MAG: T9SS type A sorting domain-containing protein [Flavobacteriales bacterium]|nr:T9SS type A sorting domain-containing protein [Flavobacteriales bacterium]